MTEVMKQERPVLTRKPIRPTPDEGVDPVDVPPPAVEKARSRKIASAKTEAVLTLTPRQEPVAVFPFSTRLSQEVMDILKSVTNTGVSKRDAVEYAIRMTYGQGGR